MESDPDGRLIGVAIIVLDAILATHTKHMRVPPLAVGLGIYLPTASTLMIVVGTIVGWFYDAAPIARGIRKGRSSSASCSPRV